MELDDILSDVGDFGKYQWIILACFCLPICFFSGIQSFIQLFLSAAPKDYWCKILELSYLNKSMQLELGTPMVERLIDGNLTLVHSRCTKLEIIIGTDYWTGNDTFLQPSNRVETCTYGWNYETEVNSFIQTWDLVCEKDFYPTLALIIFTIGSVCGLILFGMMSDYFGRKISMFVCLGIQMISGIASAFAPNFVFFCVCRFFMGLTIPSSLRTPMIYAIELVLPEKRTRMGIWMTGFYTLGTLALVLLAFLIPEWRHMALISVLPEVLFLACWWIVPESPRWLLTKNRIEEMKQFLREAAKFNEKTLSTNTLHKVELIANHEANRKQVNATIFDLFRLPNLRKKTLLVTFIWFSNICVYMGLSYYSPTLPGYSIFLNYFLAMIIELPAYPSVWFLTEKLGRRLPLCIFMVCSGILCTVTVGIPEKNPEAILVMYLLGKYCISASFFIICIYAGELYPTVIRGIGLGTSATIATLGVCLGPLIIHLGKDYMNLPLLVFGIFAIVGGFLSLFLPETWHQRLPETLQEGEDFGKSDGLFEGFKISSKDYIAALKHDAPRRESLTLIEKYPRSTKSDKDKEEQDEVVFDRKVPSRTIQNPPGKKPVCRMNSSNTLLKKKDPVF